MKKHTLKKQFNFYWELRNFQEEVYRRFSHVKRTVLTSNYIEYQISN